MPEAANREFWKDLQPIPDCFKPDAKPEVYLHNAPADDESLYVPFTDTVKSRPLWISPSENRWCDILMARSAGLVFLGGRHEMCEMSGCHGHCFHEPPRERCLNCAVSAGGCSENIISPAPEGDTG